MNLCFLVPASPAAGWWASLAGRTRWTPEWSLEALAAVQRTELSLAATMDTIYKQVCERRACTLNCWLMNRLIAVQRTGLSPAATMDTIYDKKSKAVKCAGERGVECAV